MLAVAVLGPVQVHRDGVAVPVPAGLCTDLLLRLAVDAGRPVRVDRLIEDLWAGDAAGTARNTLQSKVSQLRRALGDPALVVGGAAGYALAVDPDAVDAFRAAELASRSSAVRAAGDPTFSLRVAQEGLELFRGEPLADVGDADWAVPHRVRMTEVRLGLLEDEVAARVALGDGAAVVGRLEALVEEHPLREGLWEALVTALYRAGRQADALAAYARVRRLLAEELGLEPGPALRALEAQVLAQSLDLSGAPVVARRGNLPALSSSLVGRADEVSALAGLVAGERLVTVVGTAGVGKSRLAVEVARGLSAPGGVWLVRLDAAGPSTSLGRLVAETLDVPGGEAMLGDRLAGVETVLVLDTCEHLVDAVGELVTRLLAAAPGLRVLATSQVPLGLDGEAVLPLEPLDLADAVALFEARAKSLRRFEGDAETVAVVEQVCRSLDGLPLAIELAAARVRALSVQEIARRLDDRFALLRDPTARRPGRRRALSEAIGWSYDLLFPDDQRGLWALAGFAGGAPLAAAEHVLGALDVPAAVVTDVVERLVERSLVGVEVGSAGAVRYQLLDSIRLFAGERAAEAGVADVVGRAHAQWFAERALECDRAVRGPGQGECLEFARAERANLDAAIGWAAVHEPALAGRIALAMGWTWVVLGDGVVGARRVRAAVEAAGGGLGAVERARALLLASWLEASAGDLDRAEADLGPAFALDDPQLRVDALRHRAFLRIQQGRRDDVVADAAAAVSGAEALGWQWQWQAQGARLLLAYGELMCGRVAEAAEVVQAARGRLVALGDDWGLVHADGILATVAQVTGRFADAAAALERAAEASQAHGFLGQAALHLTRLGRVEHLAGRADAARATLHRALAAATTAGDRRIAATARVHLARVLTEVGDDAGALALLEEAHAWHVSAGGGEDAELTATLLVAARAAVG